MLGCRRFQDYWSFVGGKDPAARQVENAVPPPIGLAIGLAIRSAPTGKLFEYATLLRPDAVHPQEESARELTWAPSFVPDLDAEGARRRQMEPANLASNQAEQHTFDRSHCRAIVGTAP